MIYEVANKKMYAKMKNIALALIALIMLLLLAPPSHAALHVEVPEFASSNRIDIHGTLTDVENPQEYKVAARINGVTQQFVNPDFDGDFTLSSVLLETDQKNAVVLRAVKDAQVEEKAFTVTVDTSNPQITVQDFPTRTSTDSITVEATTSESPLFITAKVTSQATPDIPLPAPRELSLQDVTEKTITFSWNPSDSDDIQTSFKHYVIYRNSNPIDIISTPSDTTFTDETVASETSYVYEVSTMNIHGTESEKSTPLVVETLPGDAQEIIVPNLDIYQGTSQSTPLQEFEAFPINVQLGRTDGDYIVTIEASDQAGNKAKAIERTVQRDTTPLSLDFFTPNMVFENRANNLDIAGSSKPYSKVILFVKRNPLDISPEQDFGFDLSGLPPDEIQFLSDNGFDVSCTYDGQPCMEFTQETTASPQGSFTFKDVDITPSLSFGKTTRETELINAEPNRQQQDRDAEIVVVAIDDINNQVSEKRTIQIGSCFSQDQAWSVSIDLQDPPLLSEERLAENSEELYLLFSFDHFGAQRSSNEQPRITSVDIQPACDRANNPQSFQDMSRFEKGCELFENARTKENADGTKAYSIISLKSFEGMEQWQKKNWSQFKKDLIDQSEITFPLKVTLTYNEDKNGNGCIEGKQNCNPTQQANAAIDSFERETGLTQTSCIEATYALDNTKFAPDEFLPEFLLVDTADFLGNLSEDLESFDENVLEPAQRVAGGACIVSYAGRIVTQTWRRAVTSVDDLKIRSSLAKNLLFDNWIGFAGGADDDIESQECEELVEGLSAKGKGLKDVPDTLLKKCFKRSYDAWQLESDVYQAYRWSCDRFFGHAAPAKWTENEQTSELKSKVEAASGCAADQSFKGQSLQAKPCEEYDYSGFEFREAAQENKGAFCLLTRNENTQEFYILGDRVDGDVYQVSQPEKYSSPVEHVVKVTDASYVTRQNKDCASICGDLGSDKGYGTIERTRTEDGKTKITYKNNKKNAVASLGCLPVNECRSLIQDPSKSIQVGEGDAAINFEAHKYTVFTEGFSTDCFYGEPAYDAAIVSDNPNTRHECCCVLGDQGKKETEYFEPDDIVLTDVLPGGVPVHEAKSGGTIPQDFKDMKFSYRYHTQGLPIQNEVKEYNPLRYIQGRDLPACFGTNTLTSYLGGDEQSKVQINPFTQHTAAFQCGYITGIRRRFNILTDIMRRMNQCLVTIRETGETDGGNCKELFTHHVCGTIWQLLNQGIDKCGASDLSSGVEKDSEDFDLGIGDVKRGFTETIASSRSDFSREYPNSESQARGFFGTGQASVARKLCLGALGYDWDGLGIDAFIDLAQQTPSQSVVKAVLPKRKYITVNPNNHARYEYRTGIYINPGCPLSSYEVDATCVTQEEVTRHPNQIDCSSVGGGFGTETGCDCISQNSQLIAPHRLFSASNLEQGEVVDISYHDTVISPKRYDHLRIRLIPDPRLDPEDRSLCFPEGYEDGIWYAPIKDVSGRVPFCDFDPTRGGFYCDSPFAFDDFGLARFESVNLVVGAPNQESKQYDTRLTSQIPVTEGDSVFINARITNEQTEKCMRVQTLNSLEAPVFQKVPIGTNDVSYTIPSRAIQIGNTLQRITYQSTEPSTQQQSTIIVREIQATSQRREQIPIKISAKNDQRIVFTKDSETRIKVDSDEASLKEIFNLDTTDLKAQRLAKIVFLQSNQLIIDHPQKQSKILIESVSPIPDPLNNDMIKAEGIITIEGLQNRPTDTKQVSLEIFNLFPGTKLYSSQSDCDQTSPAQTDTSFGDGQPTKKDITLSVTQRPFEQQENQVQDTSTPDETETVESQITNLVVKPVDSKTLEVEFELETDSSTRSDFILSSAKFQIEDHAFNGNTETFVTSNPGQASGIYKVRHTLENKVFYPGQSQYTITLNIDGEEISRTATTTPNGKDLQVNAINYQVLKINQNNVVLDVFPTFTKEGTEVKYSSFVNTNQRDIENILNFNIEVNEGGLSTSPSVTTESTTITINQEIQEGQTITITANGKNGVEADVTKDIIIEILFPQETNI